MSSNFRQSCCSGRYILIHHCHYYKITINPINSQNIVTLCPTEAKVCQEWCTLNNIIIPVGETLPTKVTDLSHCYSERKASQLHSYKVTHINTILVDGINHNYKSIDHQHPFVHVNQQTSPNMMLEQAHSTHLLNY